MMNSELFVGFVGGKPVIQDVSTVQKNCPITSLQRTREKPGQMTSKLNHNKALPKGSFV